MIEYNMIEGDIMRSLRTKLAITMLCMMFTVIMIITLLSVVFIRSTARRKSDQLRLMLCQNGQYSLNYYFDSVWEQVMLSRGFAIYDPKEDNLVQKIMQRADMLMYENKRERKMCRET